MARSPVKSVPLCLIVYDIVCDRRRAKLYKLLKQYGIPVQKSAFEARLTMWERRRMMSHVHKLVDCKEDVFTVYVISYGAEKDIWHIGRPREDIKRENHIIV